jgi:TetR/AcrR family transcriptional repressor of nem operon
MAEACTRAIDGTVAEWKKLAASGAKDPLAAVIAPYLSVAHIDHPEQGCLMAALGPEVSRQAPNVRRAVTDRFNAMVETLTKLVPGANKTAKRKKALTTFSGMVGAMVLARMVDDPKLAAEILDAMSASMSAAKAA